MIILITHADPEQIDISTVEKPQTFVAHWKITYKITFDDLPEHTLTGEFEWGYETCDLKKVTKYIKTMFKKILK